MGAVRNGTVGRWEAQDEAALCCVSLVSSAALHSGTETLQDGHIENFVEGSTDSREPLVKRRKIFDRC